VGQCQRKDTLNESGDGEGRQRRDRGKGVSVYESNGTHTRGRKGCRPETPRHVHDAAVWPWRGFVNRWATRERRRRSPSLPRSLCLIYPGLSAAGPMIRRHEPHHHFSRSLENHAGRGDTWMTPGA
jgi:hypothetical protein